MRLAKLFFILALPAFIWNAPLRAGSAIFQQKKLSPWDLLSYENFSYDNVTTFVIDLMYGEISVLDSLWSVDDVSSFVAHLARQGIPYWDTQSQESLEEDIAWLFDDHDNTELEDGASWFFSYSHPVLAGSIYSKPEIALCKNWVGKKWKKTKQFTKKHSKKIIIATAVVAVGVTVIILTNGAAAPAVAAAGAKALSPERSPVNKPGAVYCQDDPSPQNESATVQEPLPRQEPLPPTFTPQQRGSLRNAINQQKESLKEALSEELPSEPLNIPPEEQPTFWHSVADKAKETSSKHLHEATEIATDLAKCAGSSPLVMGAAGYLINKYEDQVHQALVHAHEGIDKAFDADFAYSHTQQGREEISHIYEKLGINIDVEPNSLHKHLPPDGLIVNAAKKLPVVRGGSVVAAAGAAAAIGSQIKPVIPPSVEKPTTVYRSTDLTTGQTKYVSFAKELEKQALERAKQENIKIEPVEGLKELSKSDAVKAEKALTDLQKLPENHPSRASQLQALASTNPLLKTPIQNELSQSSSLPPDKGENAIETAVTVGSALSKSTSPQTTSLGNSNFDVEATSRQLSKFRKQLEIDGKSSLEKSKISIQKRLDEHLIKLDKYKQEGGYTSSIEREIKNFQQELQAIDTVLEEANG